MITSKWEIRPGSKGADWEYYHPVYVDGKPHEYKGFLRLIVKSSGAYLLEARRAKGDRWTRFEEGRSYYFDMKQIRHVTLPYPTVSNAVMVASYRGLLPSI